MAEIELTPSVINRFWKYVFPMSDDLCWIWTGYSHLYGYGLLRIGSLTHQTRRMETAHRISYAIHHGDIPVGMFVCHRCDHPECVNPNHLFLGNNDDNMRDCYTKNRTAHGEKQGRHKLTANDVLRIREYSKNKTKTGVELAKTFGISRATVSNIINGKIWVRVKPALEPSHTDSDKFLNQKKEF